jgi:hypothetical protein
MLLSQHIQLLTKVRDIEAAAEVALGARGCVALCRRVKRMMLQNGRNSPLHNLCKFMRDYELIIARGSAKRPLSRSSQPIEPVSRPTYSINVAESFSRCVLAPIPVQLSKIS